MQRKQAIIAGLLAGSAVIGAIAYSQRSHGPAVPVETVLRNGSAAGPAQAEGAAPHAPSPNAGALTPDTGIEALRARLDTTEAEIIRLQDEIATRDARIEELTAAVSEREARLATLETELASLQGSDVASQLAERDARIEELTAAVAERSAGIERIRSEMEAMVAVGDLALAERTTRIEELTATIAERDAAIATLQGEVEALGAEGDLGPVLAERDSRIGTLASDLATREAAIARLESEVEALRGDSMALNERERAIADLTAALAEREVAGNALRAELEALRAGADLGPALAAQEEAADRRVAVLAATLAERNATIQRLQNDIETMRGGTGLAPTLAAAPVDTDKPLLAFGDQSSDAARLGAMLDAIKLGPEITVPVANPAPGIRLAAALRPAHEVPALAEVHFEMGSASLSPGARARAAAAVVVLGDMPVTRIQLIGFADRTGSPALNQRLAEERAAAVAAFLIANGLSPEVIEVSGVTDAAELPVETGPGVSEPLNRSVSIVLVPAPTG